MHRIHSANTLRSARQRFFETGQNPRGLIPDTILDSWRRCQHFGLTTDTRLEAEPLEQAALRALHQQNEDIRRLCRPEMEALYTDAKATDSVVILTTPDGLILDAMGSAEFLNKAARVALRPGVTWSEVHTGTNAIGTALHERRPVEVRGAEHYFGVHRLLSCSASPIFDGRGRTVGVLDLSGDASVHQVHALGMVRFAVDQIERRLLERDLPGRDVLRLHPDATLLGTHREGVLVFEDHHLVAANRYALDMLGVDWSEVGHCRYDTLFESATPRGPDTRTLHATGGLEFQSRHERVPIRLSRTPRQVGTPPLPLRQLEPLFDEHFNRQLDRHVRLLDADIPILLHGETGSGKEVVARELHHRSTRANGPFVAVDCAALPEGLIEAELFGYRAGAFTGARREGARGLLREADGGVLFLDEIGDMPLALQSRLLRVLQEREITPLGGGTPVQVNFTVIAASHRHLDEAVAGHRFREDLYYRIAQTVLQLPPLREHPDLPALITRLWAALGGTDAGISIGYDALQCLAAHPWPGNMRQLLGVLRMLLVLATTSTTIGLDDLPDTLRNDSPPATQPAHGASHNPASLKALEHSVMQDALAACAGNLSAAARRLGVSRSTLYRHLRN